MADFSASQGQPQKSYFCDFRGLIAPHGTRGLCLAETIPICKNPFQPASAMPPRLDTGGLRPDPWEPPKWRAAFLSHPVERGAFILSASDQNHRCANIAWTTAPVRMGALPFPALRGRGASEASRGRGSPWTVGA